MVNEIKKKCFYKGKLIFIFTIDDKYFFKIEDKCNKKEYYSYSYSTFKTCEKDSYKVAKNI